MNRDSVNEYISWLEEFGKIYEKYINSSEELELIYGNALKKFHKILSEHNTNNKEEDIIRSLKELVYKFSVVYDANESKNKSKIGPRSTDAFKQDIYEREIAVLKKWLIANINNPNINAIKKNDTYALQYEALNKEHETLFERKKEVIHQYISQLKSGDEKMIAAGKAQVNQVMKEEKDLRVEAGTLIKKALPAASIKDTDYVFITFIRDFLPVGIVGLLLAVIFSASMSSTSSELNSLATTTVIDIYKRSFVKDQTDQHYLFVSKAFTLLWGAIAVLFALSARLFENLIQAVNIVGSLFYGTILGIFLVGFFMKAVKGQAVFIAAIATELIILLLFYLNETGTPISFGGKEIVVNIGYLWLNLIGCSLVMLISWILNKILVPASKKL